MHVPKTTVARYIQTVVTMAIKIASGTLKNNDNNSYFAIKAYDHCALLVEFYLHILCLLCRNFILYLVTLMFKLLKRAPSSPPTAPISMKIIR